jgi:IS30 family transposase
VKGKPWTIDEERQLQEMLKAGKSVRVIAKTLDKTRESIRMKIARLELEVVDQCKSERTTTTNLKLPSELPNIELELKKLSAALEALEEPGLEQAETLRLRTIIQGVKTYKELLVDYLDFRGLESRLFELEAKYAELAEKSKSTPVSK